MPILSTSLGLTRYRVVEAIPDSLWREAPKRLKDNAFRDIDATVDERSFGWCNIDNMLERVSDFLDEEIDTTLSGLMSLIEPLLIVFLGIVIGGMVICMFLPIFNLANIVNGGH